ncbi:MAG: hypothetical protein M1570_00055 [Chloroflexi bacterium]|nr:hypothetical protein [Chloroflexota bacterium]
MPLVISDASVLIHLAAIGRLTLLRDLYQKTAVPSAVWKEVVEEGKGRAGAAEIEAARQAGWIEMNSPTNEPLLRSLERDLDEGESEVIALAIERNKIARAQTPRDTRTRCSTFKRFNVPTFEPSNHD